MGVLCRYAYVYFTCQIDVRYALMLFTISTVKTIFKSEFMYWEEQMIINNQKISSD